MKGSAKARAAALLAAGAVVGGVLAATLSATAATGTSGTSGTPGTSGSSAPAATAPSGDRGPGHFGGPGGAQPVRNDERLLGAADTATLKAAALKAVPGGTVIRVETDSGDSAYEAHMAKADGSLVTVKFAKNLTVTSVEDGMGK